MVNVVTMIGVGIKPWSLAVWKMSVRRATAKPVISAVRIMNALPCAVTRPLAVARCIPIGKTHRFYVVNLPDKPVWPENGARFIISTNASYIKRGPPPPVSKCAAFDVIKSQLSAYVKMASVRLRQPQRYRFLRIRTILIVPRPLMYQLNLAVFE